MQFYPNCSESFDPKETADVADVIVDDADDGTADEAADGDADDDTKDYHRANQMLIDHRNKSIDKLLRWWRSSDRNDTVEVDAQSWTNAATISRHEDDASTATSPQKFLFPPRTSGTGRWQ